MQIKYHWLYSFLYNETQHKRFYLLFRIFFWNSKAIDTGDGEPLTVKELYNSYHHQYEYRTRKIN